MHNVYSRMMERADDAEVTANRQEYARLARQVRSAAIKRAARRARWMFVGEVAAVVVLGYVALIMVLSL